MSTASPSVPSASPSQYGASSVQHGSGPSNHGNTQPIHGHAASGMSSSDSHVGHASSVGLYPENVQSAPHHLAAGSFANTQISPMASPYGTYGAGQHPMYGGSYSGHTYQAYPNYMGHIPHYGHPSHYPATSSTHAYHNQMMGGMVPHSGYSPHAAGHLPSHHSQAGVPMSLTGSAQPGGLPGGPAGSMPSSSMVQTPSYGSASQYSTQLPMAGRHRVTTTLWEDEGTLCFQVDVKGVCVARRHDNNMVNGTKLLNVCGMSRGKRDGILKNEKERIVVKVGAMHLKGVWIAFNRAKQLAEQHGIADALYPLFEPNIQSFLYHPDNYPRTAAVMAAAQERHVQRHYPGPNTSNPSMKDMGNANEMPTGMPLHAGLDGNHWGGAQPSHDTSAGSNDAAIHYQQYQPQYYPHHQHHSNMIPSNSSGAPGMFSSGNYYGSQGIPQSLRSTPSTTMGVDRRMEHGADPSVQSQQQAFSSMQPAVNGTHRRVSGMKRSNDDYGHATGEAANHDTERGLAPGSAASSSTHNASHQLPGSVNSSESYNPASFGAQNFTLDEMKMVKRPKVSEAIPPQGTNPASSVYVSEHAHEPDTRPQSNAEVR
ncbi:hypothetical protein MYAM1_000340 [Malassezia yamatoensis]|uniref:HTH APSES-type domain-containing protein n=1 Tax=Malassezia yamatoensis TaxID=253288 RepID=A0AAJ5YNM0_9BASI|nr:hypothetical protein MYAM1_000340 [Malassezia yamatoensis]